jgi:hypothetical protein
MLRKFFSCRHNFAPKRPDLGAKSRAKFAGRSEISRNIRNLEVSPIYYFLFALSSGQDRIFRHGAGPATIFVPRN